jgi:RNA polymerase sigma-70 factor (ECF subfamily)
MTGSYALIGPPATAPTTDLSNPQHFERFVVSHTSVVLTVCLRLLKDRFAAEDACQETFTAAWRHRRELRPNRAWLLKVATNKCLDELRARSRHRTHSVEEHPDGEAHYIVSQAPTPEAAVLSACAEEVLQLALLRLPWTQRLAVVLSDVEGWSYRDIALTCDVSLGTVKSRIFRARKSLRQVLADAGFVR